MIGAIIWKLVQASVAILLVMLAVSVILSGTVSHRDVYRMTKERVLEQALKQIEPKQKEQK